ncbi:unnamed protein product [Alopecurus aequalis]
MEMEGCGLPIRVASRRLVKASDTSIEPHVLAVSNLDLFTNSVQGSVVCVYRKPPSGSDFKAVVAAFEANLPVFLNHFFPLTGRIVVDPVSSIPAIHCYNQGAELLVGDAGVELRTLDWSLSEGSVKKMLVPYAEELALSLQLVSFSCGGFAVVWGTNTLLGDGNSAVMIVRAWSELVRSGTVDCRPTHSRSCSAVFRPRDPPSYGALVDGMYTRWDHDHQVNGLTAEESFVERLYYVEGRDMARLREAAGATSRVLAVSAYLWKVLAGVVGTSKVLAQEEKRCRMLWWVDGRHRLSSPETRALLRDYTGNVTAYVVGEAAVGTVLREPLAGVAAMAREAITSVDYDELYQEMVDWMEVHKPAKYFETATFGLGSPTLAQTFWSSFPGDTDFGFGQAALAMPVHASLGRLCMGLLCISAMPADPATWIVSASLWPRLAAALESDQKRVFKPLTADYLGLADSGARPRL